MRTSQPKLLRLPIPPLGRTPIEEWAKSLTRELGAFLEKSALETPDRLLVSKGVTQVLLDGFTISPTEQLVNVTSATAVSSSSSVVIARGYGVQTLIVKNSGAFAITFKNNAGVVFTSDRDYVLLPGESLILLWDNTAWHETAHLVDAGVGSGTYTSRYVLTIVVDSKGRITSISQSALAVLLEDGSVAIAGPLNHDGTTVGLYGKTPVVQAAAEAAIVDNTGGTVDGTLQSIPNPVDTPTTADILRDDIVANTLPAIRNDFADLAAKVNKALTVLRNVGLMAT